MFTNNELLDARAPTILIDGAIHIPAGLQSDPHFIVPDEVVANCAERYKLTTAGKRGIDPMCGVGTIPRVIAAMGGTCDAVEIDDYQFSVAQSELPPGARVILGDCLQIHSPARYDYIYTSVPFIWFAHYPKGLTSRLAQAFRYMLKPDGILIIDSEDVAIRDGRSWPLAKSQIAYFTANGFEFEAAERFAVKNPRQDCDTTFTELIFRPQHAEQGFLSGT